MSGPAQAGSFPRQSAGPEPVYYLSLSLSLSLSPWLGPPQFPTTLSHGSSDRDGHPRCKSDSFLPLPFPPSLTASPFRDILSPDSCNIWGRATPGIGHSYNYLYLDQSVSQSVSPVSPDLTIRSHFQIRHRRPAKRNGLQVFQVQQGGEEMERFQDQVQVAGAT